MSTVAWEHKKKELDRWVKESGLEDFEDEECLVNGIKVIDAIDRSIDSASENIK